MIDPNDQFPLYKEPFDMVNYVSDNISSTPTVIITAIVIMFVLYLLSWDRYDK